MLMTSALMGESQRVAVSSWQELSTYFEDVHSLEWVVFDIDLVLIQPACPEFQMVHCGHYPDLISDTLDGLSTTQCSLFWALLSLSLEHELVDPIIPSILSRFKEKGISYFAITNSLTGPFATFSSAEEKKKNCWIK